ncbi:hypothetical protein GQ600_25333 [Phytophthora cactorum]|nr:hypothetical protein GQ600_25333 [Phytophthora cactorum]
MSRAEWNKRLMRTKKGDDGSQLVPEGCDLYQRVYICTHGWKKRKSRSEGSRPKQHIRLTDCPFRFVAQCNLGRGELQVKHGCFMHNHVVSPSAYATYPTFRGVENALVEARTEGMLAVGAKRSRIYDYLLEHDQNVIQVDVDNMVREHASSVSTVDDNGATAREIVIFAAADPENLSSVAKTAGGETGVISLATAHMHPIYGRFCEVLLVDSSHKTNSNYDEEMSNIIRFTTHYVAEKIEKKYAKALEKCEIYTFTKNDEIVVIAGTSSEHKLCVKNWRCGYERHGPRKDQLSLRTHAERYREAIRATHVIASELVNIGDESELNEMLTFVSNQWRNKGWSAKEAQKENCNRRKKSDRKWFEAAEEGRKRAEEVTLNGLMAALDREQPSLNVTQRAYRGSLISSTHTTEVALRCSDPGFMRATSPKAKRIFTNQAPYFNAANAIDTHLKISAYKSTMSSRRPTPHNLMPIAAVCRLLRVEASVLPKMTNEDETEGKYAHQVKVTSKPKTRTTRQHNSRHS